MGGTAPDRPGLYRVCALEKVCDPPMAGVLHCWAAIYCRAEDKDEAEQMAREHWRTTGGLNEYLLHGHYDIVVEVL